MKILNVIGSTDPRGGGPMQALRQFVDHLRDSNIKNDIVSLDNPDVPWLKDNKYNIFPLGPGFGSFGYSPRLKAWLDENLSSYDVIIIRGIWQYQGLAASRAALKWNRPYFVFTHGMLDPWFKRFRLKHLKKCLYWKLVEYRVLRDARAVLFTSEEEKLLARQSFRPYLCNERVVSYGTAGPELDRASCQTAFFQRFPTLHSARFLLFLSRIHPKKGGDLLISAFAEQAVDDQELKLVIAGPDQIGEQARLMQKALALGISDRIYFVGMLEGPIKWGAFFSAEAFILPSHQENFGIAVAESLSCATPVLISNKINIWREIELDGAGLVAEDTLQGTKWLLEAWQALDERKRQTMSSQALNSFQTRFTIARAASSLLETVEGNI